MITDTRSAGFLGAFLFSMATLLDSTHAASPDSPLLGLSVFATDGIKVGRVTDISATAGRIDLIRILTGSTLGFGERVVEIPLSESIVRNDSVVLRHLNSDDVAALPNAASENNGPQSEER